MVRRPTVSTVTDALVPSASLCRALGGGARLARRALAGGGLDDVAEHDQHRRRRERVGIDRVEIGHEDHVALVDRLPASDRRAVEHQPVGERSEEPTSELQSLMRISYAVFCLKKKNKLATSAIIHND